MLVEILNDGPVTIFLDTAELAKWLGAAAPEEICRQLVSEANQRDGSDNISVVIVNIEETPDRQKKFRHPLADVFREAALLTDWPQ